MQKGFTRATLLGSVAIAVFSGPAFAQGQGGTDVVPPAGTDAAATPQASAADAGGEADIIVTAQRREERAQDVPIVISAFSSERLDQLDVNEPQDLYGTVPSLVVGNQGTSSREAQSFTIRGQATGYQSSPAVQIYLNEVPLIAASNLGLQGGPGLLVDLENVQVLSGPQGTLFGRNTTGGAVLYVPRKPTNNFEGYVEGGVGNLDLLTMEGAINIPIVSDKLLVRVVGAHQSRRGYTRDLVWDKWRDDVNWYSGRVGITFKPTDRFENYLMLFGSKSSNNGAGHIHRAFNIEGFANIGYCSDVAPIPGFGVDCDVYRDETEEAEDNGPRRTRFGVDAYSKISVWGGINTSSFELTDELTLRNIISLQRQRVNAALDQDGTPFHQYGEVPDADILFGASGNTDIREPRGHRQFTEELQLQGNMLDNRLQFAVGAFYFKDKTVGDGETAEISFCPAVTAQPGAFFDCGGFIVVHPVTKITSTSKALYAQGTLDLGVLSPWAENVRLTAGYRYTWDETSGKIRRSISSDPELKFKAPTWLLGLDYRPIDNLMVYGKISRGYKAGGITTDAVRPETLTFLPEELTTFETGFKSDWRLGDMPFRLNATYYFSDYSNIHRPAGDVVLPDAFGSQILGAEAHVQGFEIETSIRPVRGVELGATISHTDADYKKFDFRIPDGSAPFPACNGLIPAGSVADLSCNPFQFTTDWIYNIYGSVDVPIPESLGEELSLYLSYAHVSEQETSPLGNEPGSTLGAHGLMNGSITWRDIGRTGFDLTVFGNNLFDKLYRVSNSNVYNGGLLVWSTLYGEPRTYGLKLKYNFGQVR